MYFGIIITSNLRRANVKIIKVIYKARPLSPEGMLQIVKR